MWKLKARMLSDYFREIPDEEWMQGMAASRDMRRFCAWGRLIYEGKWQDARALEALLGPFPQYIATINNGTGSQYDKLSTPRLRIIAALTDIVDGKQEPWILRHMKSAGRQLH